MIIKLHGFMGKKYGKQVELAGDNMFQLMSGLVSRFGPGFKEDIRVNDWHLIKEKRSDKKDIGQEELGMTLRCKVLHLVPAIAGKSGGVRIIIGAVMIVAGVYFEQPWLVNLGASLMLGGAMELLIKPPIQEPTQSQNDAGSYLYNGAVNVTSQGGPIPLVYGRVTRASSVVITTDFSSDQL